MLVAGRIGSWKHETPNEWQSFGHDTEMAGCGTRRERKATEAHKQGMSEYRCQLSVTDAAKLTEPTANCSQRCNSTLIAP